MRICIVSNMYRKALSIYYSRKSNEAKWAHTFCYECSLKYTSVKLPNNVDLRNLNELRKFLATVRKTSIIPVIAQISSSATSLYSPENSKHCLFMYRRRQGVTPERVGCNEMHINMANVAEALNVSVEYFSVISAGTSIFTQKAPHHYTSIAIVGIFNASGPEVVRASYFNRVIPYVDTRFMYCTKSTERESFNIFFWTFPLDTWSWIFLGISCIALTAHLRGDFFQIYAILMRQSCTVLRNNKTLIVFVFCTIVFAYGYESIVSSFLTVLPPYKVFKTLKELVENGYKIVGFSRDEDQVPDLAAVFKRENISASLRSSVVEGGARLSYGQQLLAVGQCNATLNHGVPILNQYIRDFHKYYPSINCHVVRNTVILKPLTFFFFGDSKEQLSQVLHKMGEAGLPSMYSDFAAFLITLSSRTITSQGNASINLGDWKILSVFVGWCSLLGITFLVFVVEILFSRLHRYLKHCRLGNMGIG